MRAAAAAKLTGRVFESRAFRMKTKRFVDLMDGIGDETTGDDDDAAADEAPPKGWDDETSAADAQADAEPSKQAEPSTPNNFSRLGALQCDADGNLPSALRRA